MDSLQFKSISKFHLVKMAYATVQLQYIISTHSRLA